MLIKAIKNQTIFLLKQKEASLTFILLLAVVLGNYITNVLTFRGTDVSQMYQPMKLLALSLNKVYFSANIQLLIVMIYPTLVAVPAGFSYTKEQQTKEEVYMIYRLGKNRYLQSKLWASFFTTTIVFTVPFMLEILMNMLSFPMNAIRDLSNLSIYNTDYAIMVHNYIGSAIYIASPSLYAILTTLFFGVVSGILGTLPVAISFVLTVKYRTLLILPTFVLLNATTYLNILDRNKSSLSWYKYLLLFDDTPKNIIVPLMGVGIIIITIFGFYLYGRNKDKW